MSGSRRIANADRDRAGRVDEARSRFARSGVLLATLLARVLDERGEARSVRAAALLSRFQSSLPSGLKAVVPTGLRSWLGGACRRAFLQRCRSELIGLPARARSMAWLGLCASIRSARRIVHASRRRAQRGGHPVRPGLALAAFLALATVVAPATAYRDLPGYVDFGNLEELGGAEPTVEVSLGTALLGFLAAAAREDEPELADALGRLRSIRLSVFQLDAAGLTAARERARALIRELEADAWEPAVSIRADEDTVHLYMKMDGASVAGMTVVTVAADGEAVFMNIVGEIDPAQLGRVASRFGVDLDTPLDR